jgi:hypothetical protein
MTRRPPYSPVREVPTKRVRDAIVSRFRAGDSVALLAWDYMHKRTEIEFCLREALVRRRVR